MSAGAWWFGACEMCGAPATDQVCAVNEMPEGVRVWVSVCDAHAWAEPEPDPGAISEQGLAPVLATLRGHGYRLHVEQTGGGCLAVVLPTPGYVVAVTAAAPDVFHVARYPGDAWEMGNPATYERLMNLEDLAPAMAELGVPL